MHGTRTITRNLPGTALALVTLALVPATAGAQETPDKSWAIQVAPAEYASAYWFRGLDMLLGQPVFVPHATATFGGGFSAYWWGYKGDLGKNGPAYFENDFGLDYTFAATEDLALTLGALTYTYLDPEDFADTTEVYAIAALAAPLSPRLSVYYDVDLIDGAYASLGVSRGFALESGLSVTPSASYGHSFGWTEKATGSEVSPSTRPNDVLLGLDLAWSRGSVALHAAAQKSIALAALEGVGRGDFEIFTLGGSVRF
jgi:hypothetical protein